MKILGHLHTINHHKFLVMKYCFSSGAAEAVEECEMHKKQF